MVKKQERKRLLIQLAATALQNANWSGFFKKNIYKGELKHLCVPGLNCYSCPGAVGACPIGSLQSSFSASKNKFPYYVLGFLVLMGALFGRLICGFLCPFGLVQDFLYRIPFFKKIHAFRGDRLLRKLKYAVLAVLVLLLPALWGGVPAFCKYLCPAGTLGAGIPLVLLNGQLQSAVGGLFWWKVGVLAAIVLVSLSICRPFCRYLCPLGAIYGLMNPISAYRIRVDKNACVHCGQCEKACPMAVNPSVNPNSPECIRCGRCVSLCPTRCLTGGFREKKNAEAKTHQEEQASNIL